MRGHDAFSFWADTHLSASQGVPKVATRVTASTALGRDHTPARQSLLAGREATVQVPHTPCSLPRCSQAPGARAPRRPRGVRQQHPETNRQERGREPDSGQTRAGARRSTGQPGTPWSPGWPPALRGPTSADLAGGKGQLVLQ